MTQICNSGAAYVRLIAACLAVLSCTQCTPAHGAAAGLGGAPASAGLFQGGGDPDAVIEWVREHGGEVNAEVGEVCPGCMRGLLATKDIEAGEVVISVPLTVVIDLGPEQQSLSEAAIAWIRRMHADPAYNATFQLYLDTLPTAHEVLSPEMWAPDMVAALQSPELEDMVSSRVDGAQEWWRYAGFADGTPNQDGLSIQLPLPAFQHVIACVTTRTFGYSSHAHNSTRHIVLLPVVDMANCADRGLLGPADLGANSGVQYPAHGTDTFKMLALRDIARGEEVTVTYSNKYLHRPDLAMLSYGFTPLREPPLMSAVDLPEGFGNVQPPLRGFPQTPFSEPDYGSVNGLWATEAELQRLLRIQAALPTTLQQDSQLLAGTQQPGLAAVLRWRIGRKRALLAAIAQLSTSLAARHKTWPCNQNYRPVAGGGQNGTCDSSWAGQRD